MPPWPPGARAMNLELLHKAADSFVDAAFDPAKWPRALQQLATSADAAGVVLLPIKGRVPGVPLSDSIGEMVEFYFRHGWNVRDQRELGIPKMLKSGIMTDQDFTTPDLMRRSPYYQEFLRPCGMQWFAGVGFEADDEIWCAAIQRTLKQGPFTVEEQMDLLSIGGKLTTAATLARRLGLARIEGLTAAFTALETAIILVDRLGRVVFANTKAEALVREPLRLVNGEIVIANPAEDGDLKLQIARASGGNFAKDADDGRPVIVARQNRCPLVLRVVRLPPNVADGFSRASAIILLTDPEESPRTPEDFLRGLFGLTRTEASLASWLANGQPVSEYAAGHGLTTGTAQQLTKQVLSKTGTHRQSQLVALINSYRLAAGHTDG